MSMTEWAKREIEIACARERKENGTPDGEWDYGCACYDSALKAFNSLMEDGHSGYSIGITKHILVRLIEGKPLTPIEDTDDIWSERATRVKGENSYTSYQCKRMSSLFKYVYDDGTVKYSDINRCYCVNIDTPDISYTNGLVRDIIDEMFPITMPYCPNAPIKVQCEDLLTDSKNGDFDTIAVFRAVMPDGEKVPIFRYFKESGEGWKEITHSEYEVRKRKDFERRNKC